MKFYFLVYFPPSVGIIHVSQKTINLNNQNKKWIINFSDIWRAFWDVGIKTEYSRFIEGILWGLLLYAIVINKELHLLEERSSRARLWFLEEDFGGVLHGLTEWVLSTSRAGATVRVQAIPQSIYNKTTEASSHEEQMFL